MVLMCVVSSSRRRVSGDGSCRTKRAVYASCLRLDKPSRMVTDAERADKCNAKGLFAERKQEHTLFSK